MTSPAAVVVLAAGEGTRMRSPSRPKVLFDFAGRSLLGHVLAAAEPLGAGHVAVVVGHRRDAVVEHLARVAPAAQPVVQAEQRGTGHAVQVALDALPTLTGTVLVLPGDTPLLRPETLAGLLAAHAGAAATLLTAVLPDPTGYGRVLRRTGDPAGSVERIVEHRDATPQELTVDEVATGVYAFDAAFLNDAVRRVGTDNAQGEQYLPDVIAIAVAEGRVVRALTAPAAETAGVNDRVQLAAAHRVYNTRLLEAHMRAGVSVLDPQTTWVDATVVLEPDVTLEPGVQLHGDTVIRAGAAVGPECTLQDTEVGAGAHVSRTVAIGAVVGPGASVGPFAYLRPGTRLGEGSKIGTYVEVKASDVGAGTKVPHLTYVGDATIGEHSNIGASSVFVNYDGVQKHRTTIGSHARTGSDTMFVAPVTIGDGAYTAAGSVIVEDVPPGALAVARAAQRNIEGWVARKRPGSPAARAAEAAGPAPSTPENAE